MALENRRERQPSWQAKGQPECVFGSLYRRSNGVLAQHGPDVLRKVAINDPSRFLGRRT
jgi:hypothetical protein